MFLKLFTQCCGAKRNCVLHNLQRRSNKRSMCPHQRFRLGFVYRYEAASCEQFFPRGPRILKKTGLAARWPPRRAAQADASKKTRGGDQYASIEGALFYWHRLGLGLRWCFCPVIYGVSSPVSSHLPLFLPTNLPPNVVIYILFTLPCPPPPVVSSSVSSVL